MKKFDEPIPTKSGHLISHIWAKLQQSWKLYKKAQLNRDSFTMKEQALKIQSLQEDLGLTKAHFPELEEKVIRNSINI